jgi:hypothetical protein
MACRPLDHSASYSPSSTLKISEQADVWKRRTMTLEDKQLSNQTAIQEFNQRIT